MEFRDYYHTLGVEQDAGADEIKKAFRRLARKYHPDVSKEENAELRMKEVNEAYAVLSDPDKRAAYDQLGRGYHAGQDFRPPPDWDTGFEFRTHDFSSAETADFSDFFSEIFGRMGGGAFRGAHRTARGEDHQARVQLELEDAFRGAVRQITLRVPTVAADGRVALTNRTLNVKIPKGVREGQVIRLGGQGAPGIAGGPAGDLLLEIHFSPSSRFRVEGRDLHMVLPVAPWEAVLGAVVTVELPGGSEKIRIPEGAQSGRQLRVRGKGIPGEPPGDLLLEIQVVLPPANTPEAREFYQGMAREFAFDPRSTVEA